MLRESDLLPGMPTFCQGMSTFIYNGCVCLHHLFNVWFIVQIDDYYIKCNSTDIAKIKQILAQIHQFNLNLQIAGLLYISKKKERKEIGMKNAQKKFAVVTPIAMRLFNVLFSFTCMTSVDHAQDQSTIMTWELQNIMWRHYISMSRKCVVSRGPRTAGSWPAVVTITWLMYGMRHSDMMWNRYTCSMPIKQLSRLAII